MKRKKGLDVVNSAPGVLRDWKLGFFSAVAHVEPGFAMIERSPGDVVHGLAFEIPVEQAVGLDAQEVGYDVSQEDVELYDGRVIRCGVYERKGGKKADPEALPSLRYARLLKQGALESGLDPAYAEVL